VEEAVFRALSVTGELIGARQALLREGGFE
jgi:hypothetical protein